ncbi:MAG: LEA type 2 family protein [Spirochaetia bacterium]|nr:LEA type 2 family protein [Spirochaetia bacterium]
MRRIPFICALLVAGWAFAPSCGSIPIDPGLLKKKPEATLEDVKVSAITLRDVTFLMQVGIKNPYPLALALDSVRFRFFVEKNQLFATQTQGALKVPANGTESAKIAVNLKYEDVEKAAKNYANQEYLDCDVQGEIIVKLPTGAIQGLPKSWEIPFSFTKKIPTVKPEVRVVNFKVETPSKEDVVAGLKKVGSDPANAAKIVGVFGDMISGKKKPNLSEAIPADLDVKFRVSFDIELENKTKSKIAFTSLDYTFFLNGSRLIGGNTKSIVNVGNKSVLKIQNEFSSKSLGDSLLKAFNDRKAVYGFKGQTSIQLPAAVSKDPVGLAFDETGDVKF